MFRVEKTQFQTPQTVAKCWSYRPGIKGSMATSTSLTRLLLAFLFIPICACTHRGVSTKELQELRRLAFDEARMRYLLTDAMVESKYYPNKDVPCPQKTPSESANEYADRLICESSKAPRPVPAIGFVRGVELSPTNMENSYVIKYDFEPSQNSHTELPKNQATAERFQRPDGTHYWVIEW